MRKNFGPNPLCYPQPVFILAAWGADGVPCCMNAAWGGISDDHEISLCISAGHKTTANILHSKAFTVSMATADRLVACDYVGIVSGNHVPDKFARAGFHATPSEFVNAPLIDELPMALECELLSYDPTPAAWWVGSSTSAPTSPSWAKPARSTPPSSAPSPSTP